MAQEIYVVIEFDRETHGFSEIEAICKSKEEAENLVKDYNARYLRYSYEWFEETYDADEADAVLAEKDAEIRKLQRAMWIARAKRAIEKIAWFKLWNASISTMNPEDGARQEFDKWKKNLGKFLKKAEEYK